MHGRLGPNHGSCTVLVRQDAERYCFTPFHTVQAKQSVQTELARATKRKLREQHPRAIVLCIFVRGDNTLPGLYVLEDFLEALSDQLGAQLLSTQRQIRLTRSTGQPIRERISFLKNYIREQL